MPHRFSGGERESSSPSGFTRASAALLPLILISFLSGCDLFSGAGGGPRPVAQRLQQEYPDLASGRFAVLADFESQDEALLFRILSGSTPIADERQPAVSTLHSREKTGASSLGIELGGPGEMLYFDGLRSQALTPLRDWRPYALLLMSIYATPDGSALEFAIHSGGARPHEASQPAPSTSPQARLDAPQTATQPSPPATWTTILTLAPGWNLLRFDLEEIGERVDLGDVEALTWRAPQAREPVELYFDDLILADNTRELLLPGDAADGMYAFVRGRRVHVGAARGERYELAFADGIIAAWRSAGGANLTVSTGLGPWPVALPEGWARSEPPVAYDDARMFAPWGRHVVATQRVLETSAFRLVVSGEWRFFEAPPQASAEDVTTRPGHIWQYTLYPSGQVFVRLTCETTEHGWPASLFGAAVAVDGRRGFEPVDTTTGVASSAARYALLARPRQTQADLLWVPSNPALAASRLTVVSGDEGRMAVIAGALDVSATAARAASTQPDSSPAVAAASPAIETAHMLRLWRRDTGGPAEAEAIAGDYQQPARLEASAGHIVTDAPGDLNHDGYNESEGCYELAPEGGVLRVKFDPAGRLRYQPTFRVHDSARQRCWINRDGQLLKMQGRDREGRAMFTDSQVVDHPVMIEVILRPDQTGR